MEVPKVLGTTANTLARTYMNGMFGTVLCAFSGSRGGLAGTERPLKLPLAYV